MLPKANASQMKCKAKNNKNTLFLRIPSSSQIKHVRERMPDADLKEVGTHLGRGDAKLGISLLAQRLHQHDNQAVKLGLQEQDCHFRNGRLSTEKSLMYMSALNLSFEQYKTLSALMKEHLGYDVLATHATVQKYKSVYAAEEDWHISPPVLPANGKVHHHFWVKNALEVLKNRLRSDRDHDLPCVKGITCVNRQNPEEVIRSTYISVVISCDGGGGSFKVTSTIALRESDHSKFLEHIGWANCDEKFSILPKGILEEINKSLHELKRKRFIFAWIPESKSWDFVCVPSEVTACDASQLFFNEETQKVCFRYEYPANSRQYKVEIFEKLTKSDFERGLRMRILPVKFHLVCDLKCMCMLQNRGNYASSRCPFCELCAGDWADSFAESKQSKMFTSADFNNYRDGQTDLIECNFAKAGFPHGLNIHLDAIELEYRVIPRLHEELGLVSCIHDAILYFAMTEVEKDPTNKRYYFQSLLKECMEVLAELRGKYEAIVKAQTYPEDEVVYNAHVLYSKAYKRDGKNREKSQFPLFERGVTSKQLKQVANVANALQLRNEYNIHFAEYNSLVEKLEQCGFEESQKAAKDEGKKSSKLVIAVETIFSKFHIEPQAYHGGSLIGNHCKQLLDHSKEILDDIENLFLQEIDAQFPPQATLVLEDKRLSKAALTTAVRTESLALRDNIASSKRDKVMKFCSEMYILTSALDLLFSALSCFEPFEEIDVQNLEKNAEQVGVLWRKLGLGARKPKLHILEAHACEFIRAHQPLGFVTEEGVEKLHSVRNRILRMFDTVKDVRQKEVYLLKRENKLADVRPLVRTFGANRRKRGQESDTGAYSEDRVPAHIRRKKRKEVKKEACLIDFTQKKSNGNSTQIHGSDKGHRQSAYNTKNTSSYMHSIVNILNRITHKRIQTFAIPSTRRLTKVAAMFAAQSAGLNCTRDPSSVLH